MLVSQSNEMSKLSNIITELNSAITSLTGTIKSLQSSVTNQPSITTDTNNTVDKVTQIVTEGENSISPLSLRDLFLKDSFNLTQLSSPNELEIISAEVDCLSLVSSAKLLGHLMISYLTSLDSTKNLILLGDFNLPDIDWNIYSDSSSLADDLAEFAYNHNLVQSTLPTVLANAAIDQP